MQKQGLRLILAMAIVCIADGVRATGELAEHEQSLDRVICGPRCVKYVLDFYGKGNNEELADLVRELQWPDFNRGASLRDLGEALNRRGIYTMAVTGNRGFCVEWEHPVIVHFGEDSSNLGHFVVLLPSEDDKRARVWSGLAGISDVPKKEIVEKSMGAILLTADHPINNEVVSNLAPWLSRSSADSWMCVANILAALLVTILFVAYRRTRLRKGELSV